MTDQKPLSRTERYLAALADLGFGAPLPPDVPPDYPMIIATRYLHAAACGKDPAQNTVRAIRTFLGALPRQDLTSASHGVLTELQNAVLPAHAVLVTHSSQRGAGDTITLGLASLACIVGSLLNPPTAEELARSGAITAERLELIALAADELDAAERRRRINDSGHLVARLVAIRSAQALDAAGAPLH